MAGRLSFRKQFLFSVLLMMVTALSGVVAAIVVQERTVKKVTRVKRPQFTERDWDGIYFENLFEQGLVGNRPNAAAIGMAANAASKGVVEDGGTEETAGFAWSKYISGSTIEDEVKALQNSLVRDVTSPVKFKSDYAKAHQSFSILSMLFGVIREYDSDVRWKKHAELAQVSFERAAANSRVGTIQAFESCKRRKEDLQEMVRGGNFAGEEKPPATLDWASVIERSPIMDRLQVSIDLLKQSSANEGDFNRNVEKIKHESELVAAMAQTLMRENMTDADDDGYLEFSKSMSKAAVQTGKACDEKDFDKASTAINLIGQSCSNCHDEWR
jgi:hypothetical protein